MLHGVASNIRKQVFITETPALNAQGKEEKNETKPQQQAHKQRESKSIQPEHKQPSGEATPAQGHQFRDVPNSQIRKIIARRLLESKTTVPHYFIAATAELDAATALRKSMKAQGTKACSFLDS